MSTPNNELFFEEHAVDDTDIEFHRFKLIEDNLKLKIVREDNAQATIDDVLSLILEKIAQGHTIIIGDKQ